MNTSVMCWGPVGSIRKWKSVLGSLRDVLRWNVVFIVSGGASLGVSRLLEGSRSWVRRWVVKETGIVWGRVCWEGRSRGTRQQGFRNIGPVRNDEALLLLSLPRKSLWRHSGWSREGEKNVRGRIHHFQEYPREGIRELLLVCSESCFYSTDFYVSF